MRAALTTLMFMIAAAPALGQEGFRWVADPVFQDAGSAHRGLVPLLHDGQWGLMGADGQWVWPPQFQAVGAAGNGRFPVRQNGKWGVVDIAGAVVTPFEFDAIGTPDSYTPMLWQGRWWAIGPSGAADDEPLPFDTLIGNEGTCMVGTQGGVPVAVNRGDRPSVFSPPGAERMSPPSEGAVPVVINGLAGHIDCAYGTIRNGQPAFGKVRGFHDDRAAAQAPGEDGWGYIGPWDSYFEIAATYTAARDFSEGLAPARDGGGKWGYIDLRGKWAIAPQFDEAYSFSDGLAGVVVGDRRGMILPDGSFAVPPQFQDFWRHDGGVLPVRQGETWGVIAPFATDPAKRLNLPLASLANPPRDGLAPFTMQPSNPHNYFAQDIASLHSIQIGPDERVMVTVLANQDEAEIALWDMQSSRLIRKIPAPQALQAVLLPGHEVVAVGLSTGHLLLVDAVTGAELHRQRPLQRGVIDLVLSPDGKWLAATDGSAVQIWSLDDGSAQARLAVPAHKLRFAPDSQSILSGNQRGGLYRHALDGSLLSHSPEGPEVDWPADGSAVLPGMALSAQGVLVNVRSVLEEQPDGFFAPRTWLDITDQTGTRRLDLPKGERDILTVDISADGRSIAYAGQKDEEFVAVLAVADLETGAVTYSQTLNRNPDATAAGLNHFIYSVDRLSFTPSGGLVVVGGEGQNILALDPLRGTVSATFAAPLAMAQNSATLLQGDRLFATDGRGRVAVWNLTEGRLEAFLPILGDGFGVEEMIEPDGSRFYIYSGLDSGVVGAFDMETLQPVTLTEGEMQTLSQGFDYDSSTPLPPEVQARLEGLGDSLGGAARVLAGGRMVVTSANVGLHQALDLATGEKLADFLATPDGEWLVVTPEGFFAASPKGAELVSISVGLRAFSVDQVYQALYRPDLVAAKLDGDPDGRVAAAAATLDLGQVLGSGPAPLTRFSFPLDGFRSDEPEVDAKVDLSDEGGGIGRIEWRLNGMTVEVQPTRAAAPLDAGDGPQAAARLALEPGENVIEIIAYNAAGLVASAPERVVVTWDGVATTEPPVLHVLAVGVNDYADGRLKLNFAANDARAFADAMQRAGSGIYSAVQVTTLLDGDVTADRLDAAFAEIGARARPQDVFLFFLAGHGKTVDGKYYFIPQDFRFDGEDAIARRAIGQDRWQEWAARVKARKSVMIYDTCESGSLTGSRSVDAAMAQSAAVERLTRAMGRTILSAATDDAPALEGYQGHGVMTWALLDGIGAGDSNGNATIEVTELASHLDLKVPEISSAAFGFRQVPQMSIKGSDFAIGSAVAVLADAPESFPATLSHVVAGGTPVLDAPGGQVVQTIPEGVFFGVFLIEETGGFARVAKDGKALGWVAADRLSRLQ